MENQDVVMTVDEVARYLQLHPLTVRNLARTGAIPAFKVGRQWRIQRSMLAKWLEEQALKNLSQGQSQNQ